MTAAAPTPRSDAKQQETPAMSTQDTQQTLTQDIAAAVLG